MPHVDELLGVATVAAAGMFAAIAIQPMLPGAPAAGRAVGAHAASAPARIPASIAAAAMLFRNDAARPAVEGTATRAPVRNAAARADLHHPGRRL